MRWDAVPTFDTLNIIDQKSLMDDLGIVTSHEKDIRWEGQATGQVENELGQLQLQYPMKARPLMSHIGQIVRHISM